MLPSIEGFFANGGGVDFGTSLLDEEAVAVVDVVGGAATSGFLAGARGVAGFGAVVGGPVVEVSLD